MKCSGHCKVTATKPEQAGLEFHLFYMVKILMGMMEYDLFILLDMTFIHLADVFIQSDLHAIIWQNYYSHDLINVSYFFILL